MPASLTIYTPLLLDTLPLPLLNGSAKIVQLDGEMEDMTLVLVFKPCSS